MSRSVRPCCQRRPATGRATRTATASACGGRPSARNLPDCRGQARRAARCWRTAYELLLVEPTRWLYRPVDLRDRGRRQGDPGDQDRPGSRPSAGIRPAGIQDHSPGRPTDRRDDSAYQRGHRRCSPMWPTRSVTEERACRRTWPTRKPMYGPLGTGPHSCSTTTPAWVLWWISSPRPSMTAISSFQVEDWIRCPWRPPTPSAGSCWPARVRRTNDRRHGRVDVLSRESFPGLTDPRPAPGRCLGRRPIPRADRAAARSGYSLVVVEVSTNRRRRRRRRLPVTDSLSRLSHLARRRRGGRGRQRRLGPPPR